MQAFGIHATFATAGKIASRCRLEDAGGPVVTDLLDKLDRWRDARASVPPMWQNMRSKQ